MAPSPSVVEAPPSVPAAARWIAAAGAFVVSLDALVNIAFPAMAAAFTMPPEAMRWVIVCYVFVYAVTSFVGGALGDGMGHGRVFMAGVVLGVVGYVVCGTAPAFPVLLLGRAVQGLGAGLVYGTAPGIVTLASPPAHRARAVGFFNAAVGLASATGPVLAGLIVAGLGWRAVFYLRVPLGLALLGWAMAVLPPARTGRRDRLVSAADIAGAHVLKPSLLAFLANGGIFAIWLLAPFYLVGTRGLTPAAGGLLFMLTPLAMTAAAPLAGRLVDRLAPRTLVAGGLFLEALGLLLMSGVGRGTDPLVVALALAAAGFGLGSFQVPNMAMVMAAFRAGHQGAAGGLAFLARTLGIVGGVLVLAQIVALRRASAGFERAFAEAFVVAAAGVALGGVLALLPERRHPAR